mgnify:CR=1 FL=1
MNAPCGVEVDQFPSAPAAWRGGPGELVASGWFSGARRGMGLFGRSPVLRTLAALMLDYDLLEEYWSPELAWRWSWRRQG